MTVLPDAPDAPAATDELGTPSEDPTDHRGSPIPTLGMIASRIMELRKRRGLMITLVLVTIGLPTVFLAFRLIAHAAAPKTYGPAGGYSIYSSLVAGVLYVFGFIVAATLGATAGSVDLTEGMFRHQVVTGRSRLALYLARIPAGLAIIVPLVAVGFTIVCVVCVFAAPTKLTFNGVTVPASLSKAEFGAWGADHADEVICNFNGVFQQSSPPPAYLGTVQNTVACGPNGPGSGPVINQAPGAPSPSQATPAQIRAVGRLLADVNYDSYSRQFLYPSYSFMIKSGLWLELEALIGFVVALGLASLIGQRTVAAILMIILEVVLTPIFSRARIAHLANLQRAVVGLGTAHLAPGGLSVLGGGGGGPGGGGGNPGLLPESTTVAVCVIVAWLVGWSVLGAWRMMTRDA